MFWLQALNVHSGLPGYTECLAFGTGGTVACLNLISSIVLLMEVLPTSLE